MPESELLVPWSPVSLQRRGWPCLEIKQKPGCYWIIHDRFISVEIPNAEYVEQGMNVWEYWKALLIKVHIYLREPHLRRVVLLIES